MFSFGSDRYHIKEPGSGDTDHRPVLTGSEDKVFDEILQKYRRKNNITVTYVDPAKPTFSKSIPRRTSSEMAAYRREWG